MIDEMLYPLDGCSYGLQSEGFHAGHAAYFVRLRNYDSPNIEGLEKLTAKQIVERARACSVMGAFMILTGFEPCSYRLNPLIREARARDFLVHIETCGHLRLPHSLDWIILSPKLYFIKRDSLILRENISRANEFKITVSDRDTLDTTLDAILPHCRPAASIWLYPKNGRHNDTATLNLIAEKVRATSRVKFGPQISHTFETNG